MDEFEISKLQRLPLRIFPAETRKLVINQALFFFFANGLRESPITLVSQDFKYVEIKDTAFNFISSNECGLMYYSQMSDLQISLNKVAVRSVYGRNGIIKSDDLNVSASINVKYSNTENTFGNPWLISANATTSLETSNFTKGINDALTLYVVPSEKIKFNTYFNISSKEISPLYYSDLTSSFHVYNCNFESVLRYQPGSKVIFEKCVFIQSNNMLTDNTNVSYSSCYSDIEKEGLIITSKELKIMKLLQPDLNHSSDYYDVKKVTTRYTADNTWTMIGSVKDSYFNDISVSESGAAIRIATSNFTITIENVFFSQCTSYSVYDTVTGGAIFYVVYSGYVFMQKTCAINCSSMKQAHFSCLKAMDTGSAVVNDLSIASCPSSNKYQGFTQAIFMTSYFKGTNISNCECSSYAAGVYYAPVDFPSERKTHRFNYSSFSHLSCWKHGLFNTIGSHCILSNCNLIENTGLAGQIPLINGSATITNCYFSGNVNLELPQVNDNPSKPNTIKFGNYCKPLSKNTTVKIVMGIITPLILIGLIAVLVYCIINNRMLSRLEAKEELRKEIDLNFG